MNKRKTIIAEDIYRAERRIMDYNKFFEDYGYRTINTLNDCGEYGPTLEEIFWAFKERIQVETEIFDYKIILVRNSV